VPREPEQRHKHPVEAAPEGPAVILGVDPGLNATGFGVIQPASPRPRVIAYGCLRTAPRASVAERLTELHRRVVEIIQRYQPTHVAVESGFYGKNARSAMLVGQARGIALLAAAQSGCSVNEYSPSEVKRAVVGSGAASKPQVQYMVQALLALSEPPRPDDASDALAVAICHLHSCGNER
jgi:crossover junction endodeoxyribonuclease RuvC